MKRNIPRKWILSDEQVIEICKGSLAPGQHVHGQRVSNSLKTAEARQALSACVRGLDAPEDSWPHLERPRKVSRT
ncbi:MAG: hypothetical protein ACLRX5_05015 [Slackia sp.]